MKNFLLVTLSVTALLAFACSRDEQSERSSASYEVISEGAASGVTSTIGDAGEPLTSTNVDTTTAFTFVPAQPGVSTDTTGTTLASELPPADGSLSRTPVPGAPSGGVARPTSPPPSGTISITPSRPVSPRPAPAPPVPAPPPTTTAAPEEPEPAEEAPEQPEEDDDEGEESAPTTTAPTTSPGDDSGAASFLLS